MVFSRRTLTGLSLLVIACGLLTACAAETGTPTRQLPVNADASMDDIVSAFEVICGGSPVTQVEAGHARLIYVCNADGRVIDIMIPRTTDGLWVPDAIFRNDCHIDNDRPNSIAAGRWFAYMIDFEPFSTEVMNRFPTDSQRYWCRS